MIISRIISREEQLSYLPIIMRAYSDQLDRKVDSEGKKDSMAQMALGRSEKKLYEVLAYSEESERNIGTELSKYGRNNENERRRYMFLLGSRKISSLKELRKRLKIENDIDNLGWL